MKSHSTRVQNSLLIQYNLFNKMFDKGFILILICFTVTALTNESCERKYSEKYCKISKVIYLNINIYIPF